MKTAYFTLAVDYDEEKTDPESLETGLNKLFDTALDTPDILIEYGDPEVGKLEEVGWGNDAVQFMRLLGEMASVVTLSDTQYEDLCESMDLTRPQLDELLERAQKAWDEHKQKMLEDSYQCGDPACPDAKEMPYHDHPVSEGEGKKPS